MIDSLESQARTCMGDRGGAAALFAFARGAPWRGRTGSWAGALAGAIPVGAQRR